MMTTDDMTTRRALLRRSLRALSWLAILNDVEQRQVIAFALGDLQALIDTGACEGGDAQALADRVCELMEEVRNA